MDGQNRFDSRQTYLLIRLEYLVGLGISIVLAVIHIHEIRWIPFIALFAYIDLIGYIPGAIAYRRHPDGEINLVYYVLYNTMHSAVFNALVVGLWMWVFGPEWALLAIPIHLCGDRALFGNFLKPFCVPFEPRAIPAFARLEQETRRESSKYFSSGFKTKGSARMHSPRSGAVSGRSETTS
jgi:predicted permease